MSVMLIPLTFEDWFKAIYSSLPISQKEQLSKVVELLNQDVFMPILESKDKEKVIEQKLEKYKSYLTLLFSPLNPQLTKLLTPELVPNLYRQLRQRVRKKVRNPVILSRIFEAFDVCEEHDNYFARMFGHIGENMKFLESLGIEEYVHVLSGLSLASNILLMALEKKEPVAELSEIFKKYADRLEPFVAVFQVHLEPELSHLKKEVGEEKLQSAKDYRGSVFALES